MKSAKFAALLVLLHGWLSVGASPSSAAEAKHSPGQRGGQVASQMSTKGSPQANDQWSADPERGWVRGDEARGSKDQRASARQRTQDKAKQNDKGKKF